MNANKEMEKYCKIFNLDPKYINCVSEAEFEMLLGFPTVCTKWGYWAHGHRWVEQDCIARDIPIADMCPTCSYFARGGDWPIQQ